MRLKTVVLLVVGVVYSSSLVMVTRYLESENSRLFHTKAAIEYHANYTAWCLFRRGFMFENRLCQMPPIPCKQFPVLNIQEVPVLVERVR